MRINMDRNKAYKAFDINDVGEYNDVYLVPKNKVITLYDGRYCAVSGFIYAIVDGKYSVLANKRGSGTPDFQGFWNCPCGFLERGENSTKGIARETYEECSFRIAPKKFKVRFVQTEPSECNNGNVTIHHVAFVGKQPQSVNNDELNCNGGEDNEVQEVKWIPLSEVGKYKWAFGHDKSIIKYAEPLWKRMVLELCYKKWF